MFIARTSIIAVMVVSVFVWLGVERHVADAKDGMRLRRRISDVVLIVSVDTYDRRFIDNRRPVRRIRVLGDGTYQLSVDESEGIEELISIATGRCPDALLVALKREVNTGKSLEVINKVPVYRYGECDHYIRHPPAIISLLGKIEDDWRARRADTSR